MVKTNETIALSYEILICRAYSCNRYGKSAADADIYRNLQYVENNLMEDPDNKKYQREFSKFLIEIKGFLSKAIEKTQRRVNKKNTEDISLLSIELTNISKANNSHDLINPINAVLDVLIKNQIE